MAKGKAHAKNVDNGQPKKETVVQPKELRTKEKYENRDLNFYLALFAVVVLSVCTRLFRISEPGHIVWDETHFGKFGSWYINRTFFFDVHPPLGKMLIGLFGVLTGYTGNFKFEKPGLVYDADVRYIGMRVCCAVIGSFLPPLAYLTTWELSRSVVAAFFAALLVIFDTGTLTLSQYILLDPILMFFIAAATYSYVKFTTYKNSPFKGGWWSWLRLTGVFLACSFSVKYVGLFIILLVGFFIVKELWDLWGDIGQPIKQFVKHFIARAVCLIALPVFLYILFFWIHFEVLYKSGDGDGFFSSEFQIRLEGNKLHNARMPEDVSYGSVVTIKNHRTGGSYLHSHIHLYPEEAGMRQQQVTCYSHKDQNNEWIVNKMEERSSKTGQVDYVRNGDLIRLEHVATARNLHSHKEPAPLSKQQYQVSGYGINGSGDGNDIWRVIIHRGQQGDKLKAVKQVFQLQHLNVGCLLMSHNKKLPKWGWEQMETTCNPHKTYKENTYWNVEEVTDVRLPFADFSAFRAGFLSMIIESHTVMLQGNAGLKPKEGEDSSMPWQWPINYRGQVFSGGDYRVYLLGNPIIFWFNLIMLAVYGVVLVCHYVTKRRGWVDQPRITARKEDMLTGASFLFAGWFLHYLPFWTMSRVLYFHHYFPAFLFNCMLSGVMLEYLLYFVHTQTSRRVSWNVFHVTMGVLLGGLLYSFYLFHPMSYGMFGPNSRNSTSTMAGLRWMDTWDI